MALSWTIMNVQKKKRKKEDSYEGWLKVNSKPDIPHCSNFSRYQWINCPAVFPTDLGLILLEYTEIIFKN
jgi:hypothetical protein